MSTKISFYNRAASSEREIPETPSQRRRVVRFQGEESSGSLSPVSVPRPHIKTGEVAVNIRSEETILIETGGIYHDKVVFKC